MILGIVFLVVVLAAIVSGIYYWQTTSQIPPVAQFPVHKDEMAGWKTYSNVQYGYELKYPVDWFTNCNDKDIQCLFYPEDPLNFGPGENVSWIAISNHSTMKEKTLESYFKDNGLSNRHEVQINGQVATAADLIISDIDNGKYYIFQRDTGLLIISVSDMVGNNPSRKRIGESTFNQILSTFKFVEPAAAVDTSTWKTYNSNLVNLSFKYPPESSYQEENIIASRGIKYTGLQIIFSDQNKNYPDFNVTSANFTADDSIGHDLINGNLDSKSSFSVTIDQGYGIIREIKSGIYYYSGYANMECSNSTQAYLFVKPPQNSGLKYISFYLGSNTQVDYMKDYINNDPCSPNPVVIKKAVQDLADDKILVVKDNLDEALIIAQTFKFTK